MSAVETVYEQSKDALDQNRAADLRHVSVLGSTGSIGRSTLDIISTNRDDFSVCALTAGRNVAALIEQAQAIRPELAVIAEESAYQDLKNGLAGTGIEVAAGDDAVVDAAQRQSDVVVAGIVGFAGLRSTLAAAKRGATVAFANKECLVSAGSVMLQAVKEGGANLLPVDSEHNAVFQVFDSAAPDSIHRIILTASGGPFRTWDLAEMQDATPEQAVAHPVWSMGAKISVDSASMMNKGLEIIEASYLFDMPEERIDVLVHPQSIVHSMVEYRDGSILSQMGSPDMRIPLAYALAWPGRIEAPCQRLDLTACGGLTFEAPDLEKFPAMRLARTALREGGGMPIVLNAANEIAVHAFLARKIRFGEIIRIVEKTLEIVHAPTPSSLEQVEEIDERARQYANVSVESLK